MSARDDACLVALRTVAEVLPEAEGDGTGWLTGAEASRLDAMTSPLRRQQFLAGHWLVRQLASDAFGGSASRWQLVASDDPRPLLRRDDGLDAWTSLSHSGDQVAAAVAERPVGLDLEHPTRSRDLVALANYLFSPEEAAQIAATGDDTERSRLFYLLWTLKEARGKRGGEGLQPSQARRVTARACELCDAEALHWSLPGGGSLALAAWSGVKAGLAGRDPDAVGWRYFALD